MTAPYAHDNLGEDNYGTGESPSAPDRYVDAQQAHDPNFYSKQGPLPFGA